MSDATKPPVVNPPPTKPVVVPPPPAKLSVVPPPPAKPTVGPPPPAKLPGILGFQADRTTLYSQHQRFAGQGFNKKSKPKMNCFIEVAGKVVAIIELVVAGIMALVWIGVLAYFIHLSIAYHKKNDEEDDRYSSSSNSKYDYNYHDDRWSYRNSQLYRGTNDHKEIFTENDGKTVYTVLWWVTVGFASQLVLILILAFGIFFKALSSCLAWFSIRFSIFLYEFLGFVTVCANGHDWWVILICALYLIYRGLTLTIVIAYAIEIYQGRKRTQVEEPQILPSRLQSNQTMNMKV